MKYAFLILTLLFLGGATAHASEIFPPEVRIIGMDGNITSTFPALPKKAIGGLTVATADLGTDGIAEVIVGSGIATEPRVYIYAQDGTLINSFLAYAPTFGGGVRVAVGDLDGDGLNEIVTGTGYSGGAHIRIFDGMGTPKGSGFFSSDQSLRNGVFLTVSDIDNDGLAEIITGAGIGAQSMVKIFSGQGELKTEFLAFDPSDLTGVSVGTVDINGDHMREIIAGRASSDPAELKIFSSFGVLQKSLTPFVPSVIQGITGQGADCNADGQEDILVSSNSSEPRLQCINGDGWIIKSFNIFPNDFAGSIQASWAKLTLEESGSLVVGSGRAYREGDVTLPQDIKVNLDQQRLYAYENGLLVKTYLVSTGVARFPTPPGVYSVQKKIPLKDYVWSYGLENPNNYSLPNVKYNLQFRPRFYLHYAYWHNNFGQRMSHGCVNMPLAQSEWIYNWANLGTPVTIE